MIVWVGLLVTVPDDVCDFVWVAVPVCVKVDVELVEAPTDPVWVDV